MSGQSPAHLGLEQGDQRAGIRECMIFVAFGFRQRPRIRLLAELRHTADDLGLRLQVENCLRDLRREHVRHRVKIPIQKMLRGSHNDYFYHTLGNGNTAGTKAPNRSHFSTVRKPPFTHRRCGKISAPEAVITMGTSQSQNRQSVKRLMRFSLRTALLLLTLLCAALGWWVVRAERQKAAVAAVREAGGRVHYTLEFDSKGYFAKNPQPWAPAWLRDKFGEDLFITLDGVYFERRETDDKIVERLVPKLRQVASLRWLELRDSSITDAAMHDIATLTQLKRLFIRSSADDSAPRTQITDMGLAQLKSLRKLRHLSLGGCTIDGSAFEHLGALRHLELIDLRETDFNDAAARHLPQFPYLTCLNLWKTRVTDAAAGEIAHLGRLEELYFWDNKLTDAAAAELAKLTRLKVLDLSGTQFSDAGVRELRTLSELQEMRLDNTLVQDACVDEFPKLRDLQVGWTRASDTLLERASRLPELRSLDCCECEHVSDAGLKYLENATSLERLFFPSRRVISNEALQSLRQAKPKLIINF